MKVVLFLYVFLFACLFKVQASGLTMNKNQQQPKERAKHSKTVKPKASSKSAHQIVTTDKLAKSTHPNTPVPYFSVFNFSSLFYSKDSLDNMQVM